MSPADRESMQALLQALIRDADGGSPHASLLLVVVVACVSRADLALPPPCLWRVPSVALQ